MLGESKRTPLVVNRNKIVMTYSWIANERCCEFTRGRDYVGAEIMIPRDG